MAPLCLMACVCKIEARPVVESEEEPQAVQEVVSLKNQLKTLFTNSVFVFIVLGQASSVFSIGGIAFWGKDYIQSFYNLEPELAAASFGLIAIGTGLVGTALGAGLLDWVLWKKLKEFERKELSESQMTEARVSRGTCLLTISTVLAVAFGSNFYTVPAALSYDVVIFLILLACAELMIFL